LEWLMTPSSNGCLESCHSGHVERDVDALFKGVALTDSHGTGMEWLLTTPKEHCLPECESNV